MKHLLNKTLIGILISFISIPQLILAQSASEELSKISKVFTSSKTFKTDFEFELFDLNKPNKIRERSKGAMYMSGKKLYMNSLQTETIINDSFNVVVNHQEKIILAGRASTKETSSADMLNKLLNNNKLYEKAGQLTLKWLHSNLNEVTINYSIGEYSSVTIVYKTNTYFIQEIRLVYSNFEGGTPCVRIKYFNTKIDAEIPEYLFNEKKVITIRNNKAYPTAHLKGYQLIQNL